jgi:EAL domain-containing protein (putative c-di-GMP-specific phosphodiesterase class I)
VPVEILTLLGQIICVDVYRTIFSGLTYVPVFTFAFLLFHNVPYDERSGCQSQNALDEYISRNVNKKTFYLQYLDFKMPTSESYIAEDEELHYIGINACRSIENINKKIGMYMLEFTKYINVIECSDETEALKIADQIRGVMDGVKAELKVPFNYLIVTGKVIPELESPMKMRQLYEYIANRFADQNSSYYYVIKPQDMDDFAEFYDITVALKDIRNRGDLDDDRIIVYAQPIYSVEQGSFRVAEALMRIKVGEKVVCPDKFIPVAETTGCVHTLTMIILNKVCKAVENLEESYDFDAISINVSSKELSHKTMYQDLLDIIEKYDIDVSKIRMEITETAMFENDELANRNMQILDREGIQLYLDDFGTGYSSLERVMNCPVKTIKFDKTLLYKSLDDNRMEDILTYMIEVLKKNGFVTLVEGVEDESQNRFSVERGFDYIQGYHYAKPTPIEELGKYFDRKTLN